MQRRCFNSWVHDHYVSNLFVFGPDGLIIACVINAPGAIHDGTLAELGGIYKSLFEIFDRNKGKCVMDSDFASANHPAIIKSFQNKTTCESPFEILECRAATSLCQSAEWGMQAFQPAFPHMLDAICYEE
jgi:DDE superfamily endonuclease